LQNWVYGLRTIKNEQFEKKFHASIKSTKKYLNVVITVNNKDRHEIYLFDEHLYDEYSKISEYNNKYNPNIEIDSYTSNIIKNQYNFFSSCSRNVNEMNFYDIQKGIFLASLNGNLSSLELLLIDKDKDRTHELAMTKMQNEHIQLLKDKDIKEKELMLKLENKNKTCQ
jgi:hypothetical protein